ncbi:TPA: hypothetical protein ACTZ5W_005621 [Bacillus cereus]
MSYKKKTGILVVTIGLALSGFNTAVFADFSNNKNSINNMSEIEKNRLYNLQLKVGEPLKTSTIMKVTDPDQQHVYIKVANYSYLADVYLTLYKISDGKANVVTKSKVSPMRIVEFIDIYEAGTYYFTIDYEGKTKPEMDPYPRDTLVYYGIAQGEVFPF